MPANDNASVTSAVFDEGCADFLRFLQSPSVPKASTKEQDEERGSIDDESQGSLPESLPDGPKAIKARSAAVSVMDEASVKPHDAGYEEFLMFLQAPSPAQKSGAETLDAVPSSMEEDGEKHLDEKFREGGAIAKPRVAVGEKSASQNSSKQSFAIQVPLLEQQSFSSEYSEESAPTESAPATLDHDVAEPQDRSEKNADDPITPSYKQSFAIEVPGLESSECSEEFLTFLQSPSANAKQQDEERGSIDDESQVHNMPANDDASVTSVPELNADFLIFLQSPSVPKASSKQQDEEQSISSEFSEESAPMESAPATLDHDLAEPQDHSEKTADDPITPSYKQSFAIIMKLTPLVIGWIPLVVALAIVAFSVLIILSVLGLTSIIVLMAAAIPIGVILRLLPQLQLMGYEQLSHSSITSSTTALKATGWSRLKRSTVMRSISSRSISSFDESTPWLSDVKTLLSLSDYVYLLSDFRKMSLTGKVPVEFKYLELECDRMDQWDVIKGKRHTRPAFDEHGKGHAGIRPSVLIVTILHFLINKAIRRGSSDDVEEKHVHHTAMEEEELRGLNEFDHMFLGVVKCSSYSCDKHKMGGTLCSMYGLHGVQCFMDAIVADAEKGSSHATSLLNMLTSEIDDEEDADAASDAYVEKINKLLFRAIVSGNLVSSKGLGTVRSMFNSDTRIVWTNDRSADECLYLIAVSFKKRHVYVIFRGTVSISDMLVDVKFDVHKEKNPIQEDYTNKTTEIEVHKGFAEYLFDKRDDTGKTKYDEIADRACEYGKELGDDGFSLYVTGHSLGGSLSQLFGFRASTDGRFTRGINNPVRVFSFASPIPGHISFAHAFQYQEKMRKLQHLRILNDNDPVPVTRLSLGTRFAQTGVSICLTEDESKLPYVQYVKDVTWWSTFEANVQTNMFLNAPWSRIFSIMTNHGTRGEVGYIRRLANAEIKMKECGLYSMTLDELYEHYAGIIFRGNAVAANGDSK